MSSSQEQSQEQLQFETLVVDNDYEIASNHYPYIIRRRSNHRVVKECDDGKGYHVITLNGKQYRLHRVIATQWIPNDDPANKTQIDHINHDRSDNRLENLRWCTPSENMKNRSKHGDVVYEFEEELSINAFEVTEYNHHTFDNLWFDPDADCFYYYTGAAYREFIYEKTSSNALRIRIYDNNHVKTSISLNKFKQSLEEDDSDEE